MMRALMLLAAACVSASAYARSPAEEAALREAKTLRFIIAAGKNCAAIQDYAPAGQLVVITKDPQGRPVAARTPNGVDMVFEYEGKGLAAVTTGGQRVDLEAVAKNPDVLDQLKARAILFEKAKEVCGEKAPGKPSPNTDFYECGSSDCGNYMGSWFSSAFWADTWMPSYYVAPEPRQLEPVCLENCRNACDIASDAINVACGVAGYYASLIFTPGGGLAVATACAAGSFAGKYYCRFAQCVTNCTH